MELAVTPIEPTILPDSELEDVDEAAQVAEDASIRLKLSSKDCGERLDKALSRLLPQYSRSRIQQWIEAGFVLVDGQSPRGKSTVFGDEIVLIEPQSAPQEHSFAPEPIALNVVHEDADVLVLNKPAGLVVHPAAGNWSGTLLNGLLHYLPALSSVPRAGIVHRLDKDTSGLMVVAKTLESHTDLIRQLQARTVRREYLALVWGSPQLTGRIDAAIARHPRDRIKMSVSQSEHAKPAVTHFKRLSAGKLNGRQTSLVQCKLETGRTHQIRVHMQSIGFPLVGDPLYGKPHLAYAFERQALHACRLGFLHPRSGKDMEWTAAVPDDMRDLFKDAGVAEPVLD